MSKYVLCVVLFGVLLPACGEDKGDSPLPSEGEGQGEGEGAEGEGPVAEGEGEPGGEGEGEGPICACASDADCQDGNFCNGVETCDCACSPGTPPDCADEFECTEDRCANNTCVNVPAHARCGAGKICRPEEGGCVAPPPCRDDADCVPDDPCQTGACDAATRACAFAPFDGDEDGHAPRVCGGEDCDDSSGDISPEQEELCNEQDDNCDGEVDEGFDITADSENCGGCYISCSSGQICRDSQCVCTEDFVDCNGICVDLATSRLACGRCGNRCPDVQNCENGTCRCPGPDHELCEDECVSLESNPEHCGRCGNECHFALVCHSGACACHNEGDVLCGDPGCPPGNACSAHCKNLINDQWNCGQCENECPLEASCVNGECRCPDGLTLCNDRCTNVLSDDNNCGVCGNACPGETSCMNGECRCPDGLAHCDGRCTDISIDSHNCGACGNRCTADTPQCLNGQCVCADARLSFCPDVGCVNLQDNPEHCGACENGCAYGAGCVAGQCECGRGQTRDGWADCRGNCIVCDDIADIFEAAQVCAITSDNPYHCGRCGNRCAIGAECVAGRCSECRFYYRYGDRYNCNGNCIVCDNDCTFTATDEINCGECGNWCAINQFCEEGRCAN